jgi:hypothetical protein
MSSQGVDRGFRTKGSSVMAASSNGRTAREESDRGPCPDLLIEEHGEAANTTQRQGLRA